jgi:ribosomal protein L37AE/L43A
MPSPLACQLCGVLTPQHIEMHRIGVFWVCDNCASHFQSRCDDLPHTWQGGQDDHGSLLWCCTICGAVLMHQAISTDVVEAPQETGYIDC